MPKKPTADEFGNFRVRDLDTGHERTVHEGELGHGNYEVLDEPASNLGGDPLPVKLASSKPLSGSSTNRGQQADSKKETTDA